ncbi:hypothetical protein HanRHA438_Chr10g0466861 [Helianthus annuus]|nr:hypothetical protein HanRHA438_Chr10g0466861 [Helianthus annuus]
MATSRSKLVSHQDLNSNIRNALKSLHNILLSIKDPKRVNFYPSLTIFLKTLIQV